MTTTAATRAMGGRARVAPSRGARPTRGDRAGARGRVMGRVRAVSATPDVSSEQEFNAYIKNVNAEIERALDASVPMHYPERLSAVSYTLLTLPTNREV